MIFTLCLLTCKKQKTKKTLLLIPQSLHLWKNNFVWHKQTFFSLHSCDYVKARCDKINLAGCTYIQFIHWTQMGPWGWRREDQNNVFSTPSVLCYAQRLFVFVFVFISISLSKPKNYFLLPLDATLLKKLTINKMLTVPQLNKVSRVRLGFESYGDVFAEWRPPVFLSALRAHHTLTADTISVQWKKSTDTRQSLPQWPWVSIALCCMLSRTSPHRAFVFAFQHCCFQHFT